LTKIEVSKVMKMQNKKALWAVALGMAVVILLTGCESKPQSSAEKASGAEKTPSSGKATPTPRIHAAARPTAPTPRSPVVAAPSETTPTASRGKEIATTTVETAQGATEAAPTPAPAITPAATPVVTEVLQEMDKFSFALSPTMPKQHIDTVRGKINELELKYKAVAATQSDAEEAALLERIEKLDQLAERVANAPTREEQERLYTELYEAVKLLDADVRQRRLLAPRQASPTP
jgi:hypothetical protein